MMKNITMLIMIQFVVSYTAALCTNCWCVVYGEWTSTPEGASASIPSLYFSDVKLWAWSNAADHLTEACRSVRSVVSGYFDTSQRDLVSQLVGMISGLRCTVTTA